MLAVGLALGPPAVGQRPVVEAELHEHLTNAFANPAGASSLPRVLLLGDSISIGYTETARKELGGVAEVFRPKVNCQHTGYGLAEVRGWLGTDRWDVIHFNFGIWDTHYLDAKGKLVRYEVTNALAEGVHVRHTPEQYRENLGKLLEVLKGTGAKLVWASTTPIMNRVGERFEAIPKLNEVAATLMAERGVPVDDLYGFVLPRVAEWQGPDQCHFNSAGNAALGKQVADSIRRILEVSSRGTNAAEPAR